VILGYRRDVDENCVLMGYYSASSGNFLPTFKDNGWVGCPETSVRNSYSLSNNETKCVLMGYYVASSGNFLPTFWDKG